MLKCVTVESDQAILSAIGHLCDKHQFTEVVGSFSTSKEFLKKLPVLDFDLCLLNIAMPEYDGFYLAQQLNGKPFVFITSVETSLRKAVEFSPVDIIFKPITPERFNRAIEKAYMMQKAGLHYRKKECELFSVAESDGKIKINFSDVIFVQSDEIDPRNKVFTLKSGKKLTVMRYSFEQLTALTDKIVQVNRSQAVAVERVYNVKHDLIIIEGVGVNGSMKELTLNRKYRKRFNDLMSSK